MILIANGWEVAYTYDNLDRVTEVKASKDGTSYTIGRYIYDKLGRVARFVDGQVSGKSCTYGYDLTDRLCEVFFVKHFSLKKASEFPVFSEGFSLL